MALYGEADQAAAARHAILDKLSKDLDVSQTAWIEAAKAYARRRGVLPPEFEKALATLLGQILQRTVDKPLELTKEFLNECLLGAADARSLAVDDGPESARAAASEAVRDFIATTLVDDGQRLIRRELIEEVEKQVATHSLVFVVGDGGSGKSVLAAQYLQNEGDRRFAAAALARELEENWAGRLVREWRSPSRPLNFGIEGLAEAVGRLRHANPDASRPILVLDLDGIDEASREQRPAVHRLLQQFWRAGRSEEVDAVLLVTSRGAGGTYEAAMDKLVRTWITSDVYNTLSATVGGIFVRDFGEEELSNAARLLGDDCWRRIAPALASSAHGGIGPTSLGDEALLSGASPAAVPAIVNSLRHPAMWGSFVSLNRDRRLLVLEQHSAALSALAERFLVPQN